MATILAIKHEHIAESDCYDSIDNSQLGAESLQDSSYGRGIFLDKLHLRVEMDCWTRVRKPRVTLYRVHKPPLFIVATQV